MSQATETNRTKPRASVPGFSQKLAALMEVREISQSELARKCGISKSHVHVWLNGRHDPNLGNLMKLCKAMAVPLTYFADDEDRELALCFSELDADIWRIVRTLGPDEAYRRLLQAPPTK